MGSTVMMYVLPMILGQTYDLGKEKPGLPIFLDNDTARATELENYLTDSQYRMVKNSADVRDFLSISGKLSLKIKGDMIDVNIEGSYLKDSSSKTDGLEILIKLHFETVTRTIPSSVKPREDWLQYDKDYLGTHYCRSITYGGDLIASVRVSASSTYDLERIKGSITGDISIDKGATFAADLKARLDKLKKDAQDSSSMEINYYATVPLKGVSYTIDGLMKLIEEFPDHVKSVNKGLGNPLTMELYPLSSLASYPDYMENRGLTELLSDIEDQFDDLRATRKAVSKWMISGLPPAVNSEVEKKIQDFVSKINSIYGIYLKTIAELDVSRNASITPLLEAIKAYKNDEFIMPEKYMREFYKLQRNIFIKFPELKPKVGGVLYTHWGRQDCSAGSEVVISGVIAGSESFQDGGSSDYLCSPVNPDLQDASKYFPNYDPDKEEEEGKDISVSPLRYTGGMNHFKDMLSKNIACARCRVTHRSSVFVKPGHKTCPKNYTAEYVGVLMAPAYNSVPKGSYICVDINMKPPESDVTFGNELDLHVATIQEVFVECGSLPCTPYIEQHPIPCVVCTM